MGSRRSVLLAGLGSIAWAAPPLRAIGATGAENFPARPVTLVVPFTANSGSDIIARIIGPRLSAKWGQPVIVDNRPGASGNLGSGFVAKAQPDGYTLLMIINTFTMTPALYSNLPFDPVADFVPVARLADAANLTLIVNPGFPAKDLKSLLALVKENPGKFNYASPGNGTPHHLAMELMKSNLGLNVVHVPYKGIAGALTELMGGQVQMMFATASSVQPYVGTGKVRFISITGSERTSFLPDVPTFREQGIDSMDVIDGWYALLAPARTPPPIVDKLLVDFTSVMHAPDVQADITRAGLKMNTSTSPELAALIKSDLARWNKLVATAGIKAD